MSILNTVPGAARRFARRVLSDEVVDSLRTGVLRTFYLRSMVEREPASVVWFRRHVLRRKPALHHFEIHLTDHCNLNCKGCAHFSNLCTPTFADLAEFEDDMRSMAHMFSSVRQIYLLGGEPLLHPNVSKFVYAARTAFPKHTRIYLMTNGTLVTQMKDDFWQALHDTKTILLVDDYPIAIPRVDIDLMGKAKQVKVEWTAPRTQFFKVPIDPAGGHDAAWSFKECQGYNNCPIVRDGKLYPCAYIAYADVFRDAFGINGLTVYPTDSISIRDETDPEKVMEFLRNPVHWCSNCDMGNREFFQWGLSKGEISEWTCTSRTSLGMRPPAA